MNDSPDRPLKFELRLLGAMETLAIRIAAVSNRLPSSEADDYIEHELAKFASEMRRYEGMGATPAASMGYAVDIWLRERIAKAG